MSSSGVRAGAGGQGVRAGAGGTGVLSFISPPPAPPVPMDLKVDSSDLSSITHTANVVSEWRDLSGNGRHLAATSTPRIADVVINGLNTITLDQGGDLFTATNIPNKTEFTHFFVMIGPKVDTIQVVYETGDVISSAHGVSVYRANGSSLSVHVRGVGGLRSSAFTVPAVAWYTGSVWTIACDSTGDITVRVNSTELARTSLTGPVPGSPANPTSTMTFGSRAGGGIPANIDFAAIQFPQNTINTEQRDSIENELKAKWITPKTTPNAWYDLSDSSTVTTISGGVSQLNDKSEHGHHLFQATSGARPTILSGAQNGLDVLALENTQFLQAQINDIAKVCPNNMTLYTVFKKTGANQSFESAPITASVSNGGHPFDRWGSSWIIGQNTASGFREINTITTFSIVTWRAAKDGGGPGVHTVTEYIDGVAGKTSNITSPWNVLTGQYITIGRRQDNQTRFVGQLGEAKFFNDAHTPNVRMQIEIDLAAKWGVTVDHGLAVSKAESGAESLWLFNTGLTTTAVEPDIIGANHATVVAGSLTTAATQSPSAVDQGGATWGGTAKVVTDSSININRDFTFGMWVKQDALNEANHLLSFWSGGSNYLFLNARADYAGVCWQQDGGVGARFPIPESAGTGRGVTGQYVYVYAGRNYSTVQAEDLWWVSTFSQTGELIGDFIGPRGNDISPTGLPNTTLHIGSRVDGVAPWNGQIHHVTFWPKALTQQERYDDIATAVDRPPAVDLLPEQESLITTKVSQGAETFWPFNRRVPTRYSGERDRIGQRVMKPQTAALESGASGGVRIQPTSQLYYSSLGGTINVNRDFTFGVWAYRHDEGASNRAVLSVGGGVNYLTLIFRTDNGGPGLLWQVDGAAGGLGFGPTAQPGRAASPGSWHYLMGHRNYATNTWGVQIDNGTVVEVSGAAFASNPATDVSLQILSLFSYVGSSLGLNADVLHPTIWPSVLSTGQRLTNYNAEQAALAAATVPFDIDTDVDWSLILDASDTSTITHSGGLVSAMVDKSAAIPFVTNGSPTTGVRTVNGRNVIDLDTGDNLRSQNHIVINHPSTGVWSAYMVVVPDSVSGVQSWLDQDSGAGSTHRTAQFIRLNGTTIETIGFGKTGGIVTDAAGSAVAAGAPVILRSRHTGSSIEALRNLSTNGAPAAGRNHNGSGYVAVGDGFGGTADLNPVSSPANGAFCEVRVSRGYHNEATATKIVTELASKWGVTL